MTEQPTTACLCGAEPQPAHEQYNVRWACGTAWSRRSDAATRTELCMEREIARLHGVIRAAHDDLVSGDDAGAHLILKTAVNTIVAGLEAHGNG